MLRQAIRHATEQRLAELQKKSNGGEEEVGEEVRGIRPSCDSLCVNSHDPVAFVISCDCLDTAKAGEEDKGVKRSAEEGEGEGADQTEEKAKAKKPKKAQAAAPLSFNLDEENEEGLL